MSKKQLIISLFISIISFSGFAQDSTETAEKLSHRKELKLLAKQQIDQLHKGVLLVRLKTRKSTIEALRKMGKNERADKIEKEQAEINKEIIKAFQDHFDFTKTYFFYSDFSQQVRDREFDKVELLNDSLMPDPTITINNQSFLTAEFGAVGQDTSKYFNGYRTVQGPNGPEKRKQYVGGSNARFGALVIMSDQFIQLRKPFPYYVRTYDSLPLKRRAKVVVSRMNDKLIHYYKKKH